MSRRDRQRKRRLAKRVRSRALLDRMFPKLSTYAPGMWLTLGGYVDDWVQTPSRVITGPMTLAMAERMVKR